ncbi:leucine aminopeptidase of possible plant or bacterial origin [Cryptosporidium bovis]|uniref:leucine aminopeptidase of possible plant or bacterial origin n=1 Tax=Cryptosporidium bovis TaxID=310047 RepID=UPI00351A7D97|nr:leucine aminopeptidase of possible plant or bacterial origin [Cryptosporidium bovis]
MVNPIRPERIPMSNCNENLKLNFLTFGETYDESANSDCLLICLQGSDAILNPKNYFDSLNKNLNGILYNILDDAKKNSTLKKENSFISFDIPPNSVVANSHLRKIALFSTGDKNSSTPVFLDKICTHLANINKQNKGRISSYTILVCLDEVSASDIMLFCTQFPFVTVEETRFKGVCSEGDNSADKRVEKISIVLKHENVKTECESLIINAISTSKGLLFARDLTSAPSNYCNPVNMAAEVVKMAKSVGLETKILQQSECEKLGMGAYLAVAQGSKSPPQFVHLTYKPNGEIKRRIAFVGKGITMDTGGYNIKHCMIHYMKGDMGGAAAVFGAAYATGLLKPSNVEVQFISAICDNLVSAEAYLPGCIVTASNGKTIEVGNTDAEGRLTLADALVYACKLNVDTVVDLATLTGFNSKLFEGLYASVLVNNDSLFDTIQKCGKAVCERFWQLPLDQDYKEYITSKIADLNNTSEGKAPVSTSALFLYEFVSKGVDYAHIDIAGCSGTDTFGNGFGVKTIVSLIVEFSK